jgi:hypothetical protein
MLQQLDLFQVTGSGVPCESVPSRTPKPRKVTHWTGEYDTARGRYYRYYYQHQGDRSPKHVHIRGSVVGSNLGDYRCELVKRAIEAGQKPSEIIEMIRCFPRSQRNCRFPNFEKVTAP